MAKQKKSDTDVHIRMEGQPNLKDRHDVLWWIKRGEMKVKLLKAKGEEQGDAEESVQLSDLKLTPDQELNLMADALARVRPLGREPGAKDNEGFRAAAALVVWDKKHQRERIFVHVNTANVDQFSRECAESNALNMAQFMTDGQFTIRKVYLMGGKEGAGSNFTKTTCCGSCRDRLAAYDDGKAQMIAIPLMGVSEKGPNPWFTLNHTAAEINHTKQMEGFATPFRDLHPFDKVPLTSGWVARVQQGASFVSKSGDYRSFEVDQPHMEKQLAEVLHGGHRVFILEDQNLTVQHINEYLVNAIKNAWQAHASAPPEAVRAVVVVNKDGQCFSAIDVNSPKLPTKPVTEVAALMNSLNRTNIKEVFVMEMRPAELGSTKIRAFTSRGLERLFKNGAFAKDGPVKDIEGHDVAGESRRVMLHVIPLNDGTLPDDEIKKGMWSAPLERAFPNAFVNPKGAGI